MSGNFSFPKQCMNFSQAFFKLDEVLNWARKNSIFFIGSHLACCGIELEQTTASRFDLERFGLFEKKIPEMSDLLFIAGTVTQKMLPILKENYDRMLNPKYVVAIGSCAISGGMFHPSITYAGQQGIEKNIPVDIYIPGCPPRPESILHGILKLKEKISNGRDQYHLNHYFLKP